MLLNDYQIRDYAQYREMITPFVGHQVNRHIDGKPCVSYGLSSFGYDMRIASEFKVFVPNKKQYYDVKSHDDAIVQSVSAIDGVITLAPHAFALGYSIEHFVIPEEVCVLVVGKSTYARAGIAITVTPLEPGWRGHVTIEVANLNSVPVKIYANEGIAQCLFFSGNLPQVSYNGRNGKYQNQSAQVIMPRMK